MGQGRRKFVDVEVGFIFSEGEPELHRGANNLPRQRYIHLGKL